MTQFNERLKQFTLHRNAKGCSADELASLKARYGYSLPDSYIQFMAVAGNGVEEFLRGSDFTYNQVDDMREAADQLLLEGEQGQAGQASLTPEKGREDPADARAEIERADLYFIDELGWTKSTPTRIPGNRR